MLSENGDVIKIDTIGRQTVSIQNGGQTLPCGFSLDRHCGVEGENDMKTISVDAYLFESEAKQLLFRLKTS